MKTTGAEIKVSLGETRKLDPAGKKENSEFEGRTTKTSQKE